MLINGSPVDQKEDLENLRIAPEITGASLVLLGNLNPSIFAPAWFGWHGLLPEKTVEAAELKIAQPQITAFSADWLELNTVPERFSISTTQPPFVRLRDLGIRIFRERLSHTPLHSMGINRQIHFLVNTSEERDRIGRLLAPVEPWGDWGKQLQPDGHHGGMTSLTMTQVNIEGRTPEGVINVTVQPSNRVGQDGTGIYVEVNDHYSVEDRKSRNATTNILDLLENEFEESLLRSERIIDNLMSLRGQ